MSTDPKCYPLRELYLQAIRRNDDRERKAFLDEACIHQPQLRDRVEKLLAARTDDQRAKLLENAASDLKVDGDFLNRRDRTPEQTTYLEGGSAEYQDQSRRTHESSIDVGDHPMIGHYRLLEEIGHGGMGTVYMAKQTAPVKRKVALKVIKPGMDTREVVARFEAERQALAMMDHANIAKVFDGGTTDQGRPYFVMELVRGVTITEFCKQKKLPLCERLKLFVDICKAVQHAHQKGIIHRDLKPGNVLVTMHDDVPVVKVIDFGVAKALNQELTEKTLFTQFSQIIGTPLYMAPEQAQMSGLDIDTRSDIYSLGVILYELLTGTTPFDRETMSKLGVDGFRKLLNEQEPERPSFRISTLKAENQTTVVDQRKLDSEDISKQLKRELDWIVMKALEKDRERRYDTANAFAADVQRYLNDEPVEACPPSNLYRLTKYAKKHKGLLTTATLLVAMLVASTAVSGLFAYQATEARLASEKSESDAKDAQAEAESEKVNAISAQKQSERNFSAAIEAIDKLLEHASSKELAEIPQVQAVRKRILEDVLAFYEHHSANSFDSDELRFRAALTRQSLAELLKAMDRPEEAVRIGEMARDRFEELYSEKPDQTKFQDQLAHSHSFLGWTRKDRLHDPAGAQEDFVQATKIRELQYAKSKNDGYLAKLISSLSKLADTYGLLGQKDEQFETLQAAAEMLKQLPDDKRHVWAFLSIEKSLAKMTSKTDPHQSEKLWERAIERSHAHFSDHSSKHSHVWLLHDAIGHYFRSNDPVRAQEIAEEAVKIADDLVAQYPAFAKYRGQLEGVMQTLVNLVIQNSSRTFDVDELLDWCASQVAELNSDYLIHEHVAKHIRQFPDPEQGLSTAIERFPNVSAYYQLRGAYYRIRGDIDKALTDINRSVELAEEGKRFSSLFARAKTHVANGDDISAIADFDRILDSERPEWEDVHRRGACYFRLAQYDKALADLRKAVKRDSGDMSKLLLVPPHDVAACPDEDYRTGYLQLVNEVAKTNAQSSKSLVARSMIMAAFGKLEQSQKDLTTLLSLDDLSCYRIYQAALICADLGDTSRYTSFCRKMISSPYASLQNKDIGQNHYTAWTCALAPNALEDQESAIKLAQRSVQEYPNHRQYLNGLGAILMRAGRYEEAKQQLERAVQSGESDTAALNYTDYFLAITEHHLGNLDSAREYFRKANESAEKQLAGAPAWNRRMTLNLLRDEAKSLIHGEAATGTRDDG